MTVASAPRLSRLAPLGVAALLLIGLAIWTPLSLFDGLPKSVPGEPGQALANVRSMRDSPALEVALSGQPRIGYVSEQPIDPSGSGLTEHRFYLAQLALAPVLLEDRGHHPLVLANFSDPVAFERFRETVGVERVAETVVEIAPGRALVRMESR